MKELGEKLPAGAAAVLVLVAEAPRDEVVPEIAPHGGHLIQSSLSNEQQDALQDALDTRAPPRRFSDRHSRVQRATVLRELGGAHRHP